MCFWHFSGRCRHGLVGTVAVGNGTAERFGHQKRAVLVGVEVVLLVQRLLGVTSPFRRVTPPTTAPLPASVVSIVAFIKNLDPSSCYSCYQIRSTWSGLGGEKRSFEEKLRVEEKTNIRNPYSFSRSFRNEISFHIQPTYLSA